LKTTKNFGWQKMSSAESKFGDGLSGTGMKEKKDEDDEK
jgi:hypothetical protein